MSEVTPCTSKGSTIASPMAPTNNRLYLMCVGPMGGLRLFYLRACLFLLALGNLHKFVLLG